VKFSVVATDPVTARAEATAKRKGPVHISCVFFVRGRPDVREFVFCSVLSG